MTVLWFVTLKYKTGISMIFYIFKYNYLKILSHVYNSHYISSREGSSRTGVGDCYIGLIFRIH